MFNEKKANTSTGSTNAQNRIGAGTKIVGDMTSKSGFRVDGHIVGTLDSDEKVVIGKEGHIEGTLRCKNADIEGKITGKLEVSGMLSLKSTAHIEGDVVVSKLAVEPGATFNATCTMKNNVKQLENKKGKSA